MTRVVLGEVAKNVTFWVSFEGIIDRICWQIGSRDKEEKSWVGKEKELEWFQYHVLEN